MNNSLDASSRLRVYESEFVKILVETNYEEDLKVIILSYLLPWFAYMICLVLYYSIALENEIRDASTFE